MAIPRHTPRISYGTGDGFAGHTCRERRGEQGEGRSAPRLSSLAVNTDGRVVGLPLHRWHCRSSACQLHCMRRACIPGQRHHTGMTAYSAPGKSASKARQTVPVNISKASTINCRES